MDGLSEGGYMYDSREQALEALGLG